PFGETRYTCSQPQAGHPHRLPPEHAFCSATGQREEAGLGLYFYNARWYDPALARFIQADSIVPGQFNPLAYDRYQYVFSNPLKYIDPSGHISCSNEHVAEGDCSDLSTKEILETIYNVVFNDDAGWTEEYISAVYHGVRLVGQAFLRTFDRYETADQAFRDVFGLNDSDTFIFEWDENCWGCRADPVGCDAGTTTGDACISAFGYTNGENWIEFASMAAIELPLRIINNVIHELGHAFNIRIGRIPENAVHARADVLEVRDLGFFGPAGNTTWQQSKSKSPSEIFADQFLGWVYGKWGSDSRGPIRAEFMNQMNGTWGWIAQASRLP
ncbi:MAG: RHS repeat-associated core domain-containing protein, partial [Anaerolineales bacterium]